MTINERKQELAKMLAKLEADKAKQESNANVSFGQMLSYLQYANPTKGKSGIWCCRNRYKAWKVEISNRTLDGLKKEVKERFNRALKQQSIYK